MDTLITALSKIFTHFPEPVLFFYEDSMKFANPSALNIFPMLSKSDFVPSELEISTTMPPDGICICTTGNGSFSVVSQLLEGGRLLVLRPALPVPQASLPLQLRLQITNLFGAAQLLGEKSMDLGTDGGLPEISILNQGLYRLLRLTQNLELFEELSQQQPLHFTSAPFDLAGLCHRLSNGIASLANQSGSQFFYESEISSLPTLGDSELLQIMLLNLVSNALKAAGVGGEAGLRLTRVHNSAVITVWDHGPGLDTATLTSLFDSANDQQDAALGRGLGLGLQIVRRIITLHGGTILMEGRQGLGVRATVSLPILATRDVPLATPNYQVDVSGGFPLLLVQLADALSYEAFSPLDVN